MDEELFNINTLLQEVYSDFKKESTSEKSNLIFYFGKTVPSLFKGNSESLKKVLVSILKKILLKSSNTDLELFLYIEAPEEFMYIEVVKFKFTNLSFQGDILVPELNNSLVNDLEVLSAKLEYTKELGDSIELSLPLENGKIGSRRHYRLPSDDMLNKKILFLSGSSVLAMSLIKMFKYFPMQVDLRMHKLKNDDDISTYDLFVLDESLYDDDIKSLVKESKSKSSMNFVPFGEEENYLTDDKVHDAYIKKPATQGDIFKLLVKLF